jgi:hypothetical protein
MAEEKIYGYFMQDGATTNTVHYIINVTNKVSEDRLISHRLWPARSPDLHPYDFHL